VIESESAQDELSQIDKGAASVASLSNSRMEV